MKNIRLFKGLSGLGMMVGVLAGSGPAWAAGPGSDRPAVFRHVDAAAGATVRAFVSAEGTVTVEVAAETLTIRKEITRQRAVTRFTTPVEDVRLAVSTSGIEVVDRHRRVSAGPTDTDAVQRVFERLRMSPAVHRALIVLDTLTPAANSPVTHSLLVTQTTLEHALGVREAGRDLAAWMRGLRSRVRITPVGLQSGPGPGDCWDAYTQEAIEAWIEYEECIEDADWWSQLELYGCGIIYELRAVGAFSWWVSCVGLR
jgi:hypothetical protein